MAAAWVCAGLLFGPAEAEAEAARAVMLSAAGKHDEASAAFARAYEHDPRPYFLFARARTEQRAGRCDRAIELNARFLETDPPAADAAEANKRIGECYTALDEPTPQVPVAEPKAPPVAKVPAQPPEQPVVPPTRRQWYRDPAGGVLLGIGAAAAGLGGGLAIGGRSRGNAASAAPTTEDFRERTGGARRLVIAGVATLAGGVALVIGAIVRYAVVSRAGRPVHGAAVGLTRRAPTRGPQARSRRVRAVLGPQLGVQAWF